VCIVRELGTRKREGIIIKKQKSKKKEKRKESSGAKYHLL
jgi:ATP-dependent RNA circularization protein (DNA/RNA ligase family)